MSNGSLYNTDPRPFLTIVAWPEGYSKERLADVLAATGVMDVATLRYRLGQAPPMIVGQVDPAAGAVAVHTLETHGGDAFLPTLADLARLGGTLKIKDMRVGEGVLQVDLWRGLSTSIRFDQVEILVRAHLHSTQADPAVLKSNPTSISDLRTFRMGRAGLALGMGGAMGLALAFEGAYDSVASSRYDRTTKTSDKLDIHTTDGSVYQIDGDKFGYRVLGELRGHGDKVNMDNMCDLLSHLAPDEVVDPYYSLWNAPPGHDKLTLPEMKLNGDNPAFAFYSRWAALLYRHVMGLSL